MSDGIKESWRGFLDRYEPLRPQLYRYCRYLTRSPWAAEDMVQDALARAFVTLACSQEPPENPRAWLFRVASNLWLNERRAARDVPTSEEQLPQLSHEPEPRATREAAGTLLGQLSPQERAALVLKDAFDLSLEEVATTLGTSVGAIKAALHRGRGKLLEPEPTEPKTVTPAVLDAFCQAFNHGDLHVLTELLLKDVTVELPGLLVEQGRHAAAEGSLRGTLFGCPDAPAHALPKPRCEARAHRGETLLLWWWGEEVHAVVRASVQDGKIATLRNYYHAPELIAEVCAELALPYRTHGYRFWSQAG
jgi:RNA polymerase sigma-70 factor, ECF subfamily